MNIKNLFLEYYTLSYYPGQKPKQTSDIGIKAYMILRTSPTGWNILNFWNGTSILIPWSLISLFIGLNIWGGARIIEKNSEDEVERVIQKILILVQTAERRDMTKFLMSLGDILTIKTKKFRDWYLEETGEKLSPIEINSLDRYREI